MRGRSLCASPGGSLRALRLAALVVLGALALMLALAAVGPVRAFAASSPEVIASSPEDGTSNAPCEGRMWVQFQNNVAAVQGNADLVTLRTAAGEPVDEGLYSVALPDVELEFGFRQYVWIDVHGLDPGTAYEIVVAPGIASKNGSVNQEGARIAFTTATEGADPQPLAGPVQTERGSGDGTGGGAGGSAAGSGSVADGASASEGARQAEGRPAADGRAEAPSGTDNQSAEAPESSTEQGEEAPVVYVDAKGRPVSDDEPQPDPMPAGEIVLFCSCGAVLVVGIVGATHRSRSNAARPRNERK